MKNPDVVLRELGQLYDFQQELAKFRFRKRPKSSMPRRMEANPDLEKRVAEISSDLSKPIKSN